MKFLMSVFLTCFMANAALANESYEIKCYKKSDAKKIAYKISVDDGFTELIYPEDGTIHVWKIDGCVVGDDVHKIQLKLCPTSRVTSNGLTATNARFWNLKELVYCNSNLHKFINTRSPWEID